MVQRSHALFLCSLLLAAFAAAASAQTPPLPAAAIEVRDEGNTGDLDRAIELAEAWTLREPPWTRMTRNGPWNWWTD